MDMSGGSDAGDGFDGLDGGFDGPEGLDASDFTNGFDLADFVEAAFADDDGSEPYLFRGSDVGALFGVDAEAHDSFGFRIRHDRAADVYELFMRFVRERRYLIKVPAIYTGQVFVLDTTVDGVLPWNAWNTSNMYLPQAALQGQGKRSRVFKNYFQIGNRQGPPFADTYLIVRGITWNDEAGDCVSQLMISVSSMLNPRLEARNPDKTRSWLDHRSMAKEAVCAVLRVLQCAHKPSARSQEERSTRREETSAGSDAGAVAPQATKPATPGGENADADIGENADADVEGVAPQAVDDNAGADEAEELSTAPAQQAPRQAGQIVVPADVDELLEQFADDAEALIDDTDKEHTADDTEALIGDVDEEQTAEPADARKEDAERASEDRTSGSAPTEDIEETSGYMVQVRVLFPPRRC